MNYPCPIPDYACNVGALFHITCDAMKRFPLDDMKCVRKSDTEEEEDVKVAQQSIPPDAKYLIEPKTHRMWFTSPEKPKEAPIDRLEFYNKSLQFYKDKPFEHHFWCNGKHLIPETLKIIEETFNVPVIVHDISEITERFINKNLFKKLLHDGFYAFASNIARQELLVLEGGLYTDIGMEQLRDVSWNFKKYDLVLPLNIPWSWLDNNFLAAAKNSIFLIKTLKFIPKLMRVVGDHGVEIPDERINAYLERRTWQVIAAMEDKDYVSQAFFYESRDYKYHGLGSWYKDQIELSIAYLAEGEDAPAHECLTEDDILSHIQKLMPYER